MMQSAAEAENRRDFQECIEILERASRLDPANSGILLNPGGIYGKRHDYAAATLCFEKAIRAAPKKTEPPGIAQRGVPTGFKTDSAATRPTRDGQKKEPLRRAARVKTKTIEPDGLSLFAAGHQQGSQAQTTQRHRCGFRRSSRHKIH